MIQKYNLILKSNRSLYDQNYKQECEILEIELPHEQKKYCQKSVGLKKHKGTFASLHGPFKWGPTLPTASSMDGGKLKQWSEPDNDVRRPDGGSLSGTPNDQQYRNYNLRRRGGISRISSPLRHPDGKTPPSTHCP